MALLAFMLPVLGIGTAPDLVALLLDSLYLRSPRLRALLLSPQAC